MSVNVKRVTRPALILGMFTAGVLGWTFIRPDMTSLFVPYPPDATVVDASLIDAAVVDAVDAATIDGPDAAVGEIDPNTPWTMHVIKDGLSGPDGVDTTIIDGKLHVIVPWEQSSLVTVSSLDSGTWSTTTLPGGVSSAEDAKWCDLDMDGHMDALASGEGQRIAVWFGPSWSSMVTIAAATNIQPWMQINCFDVDGDGKTDLLAGGRIYPASIGYFTSATPRDGSSYTYNLIGDVGWTMSIIGRVVDGQRRVYVSDRTYIASSPRVYDFMGERWLAVDGSSWVNHTINRPISLGSPKFMTIIDDDNILSTSSDGGHSHVTLWTTSDNGTTWTGSEFPSPSNVGRVHHVARGDIDLDGQMDLVLSYSNADGALSGVVWQRAPTWERYEISGPDGTKYDNAILVDIDGDGDLDVLQSEQIENLGLIWYENPAVQ